MPGERFIVRLKNAAQRDLDKLPINVQDRILTRLEKLAENRHPKGSSKLKGGDNEFRIRIGDYRALYIVDNSSITVWIYRIAHRKEVYR